MFWLQASLGLFIILLLLSVPSNTIGRFQMVAGRCTVVLNLPGESYFDIYNPLPGSELVTYSCEYTAGAVQVLRSFVELDGGFFCRNLDYGRRMPYERNHNSNGIFHGTVHCIYSSHSTFVPRIVRD